MYVETIPFEQDLPITFDGHKMSHYHLHCHEGVIEVLLIISGSAHVKVSFEQFDMNEGDYIIINNADSHSIYATDSNCQTASLYFNLASYREQIPYLEYVLFACESFDLVKYKNETQYLRRMIANLLLSLIKDNEEFSSKGTRDNLKKAAEELLWIFVNDYDMKNYYSRNWNAGYSKTEKYYKIMKYIFENYDKKNLMEYISKNEFYSKSYITHLFKQVGASSFQDVLTYVRLYKSEILLLDSDLIINEIADRCGFSDIKYYAINFKKWFLCTPSEYRKIYQPEVLKNSLFQDLSNEDLFEKIDSFIKHSKDNTKYKSSINPLSVKSNDMWMQIFEGCDMEKLINTLSQAGTPKAVSHDKVIHYICISIDDKSDLRDLISKIASFIEEGYKPVLIIKYRDISFTQCDELLTRCGDILTENEFLEPELEIIIAYSNLGDKVDINKLLRNSEKMKHIVLKPMLMV